MANNELKHPSKTTINSAQKSYRFLSIGALLALGFILGSCFQFMGRADKGPYQDLEKFSKVLEYIERNFVDPVNSSELIEGAISGMLGTLDPHSAFLPPSLYKSMRSETSGQFGGLGIEVSIKDELITVVAPIDETPAARAGIRSGDQIVAIEDKNTRGMNLAEAIDLMRGRPGTQLRISIMRPGVAEKIDFVLTRESIKMRSVRSILFQEDVGYLRVSTFSERTASDLEESIKKIQSENKKLRGWVLDLRGNPGGLLDQAIRVSNLFIDEGPIVYTIGRDKDAKEIEVARKGQKVTELPMVVLVDGSSASASEIVAGALQDHGRAVVAGQETFGKGSVQSIVPMGDDSGLKLTIARYYTPSGRSIQAKGIAPDFIIESIDPKTLAELRSRTRRTREADLQRSFQNDGADKSSEGAIPPLVKATESKEENDRILSFEERIENDYMLSQASGILKTIAMAKKGPRTPSFQLDEDVSSQ